MKKTYLSFVAVAALLVSASQAAVISLSTTSVGSRVVTSTSPLTPVTVGGFTLGTMTNEADFATFTAFGSGSLGTTSGFPTGGVPNGSATNNTTATDYAGKSVYVLFFSGASAVGSTAAAIYKSTELYAADLNNSPSQTKNLTVTNFTTAINPTTNWDYLPGSVNPSGITGAAGTPPTDRTGIVFTLGAAVPEPSVTALLGLLGLVGLRRKR